MGTVIELVLLILEFRGVVEIYAVAIWNFISQNLVEVVKSMRVCQHRFPDGGSQHDKCEHDLSRFTTLSWWIVTSNTE